ncbi:Fumarate reductase flavoprotein subunit [Pantoea agglomerans]|uniref:Fumarate reductase flavoprotein subunit n=1 Tax=Enterobacter agglomerans TaxID=549 RepID=A0A379LR38_ENTAG|nr:Fumarate reductase flavoprotein subunit [Pantoea agglomerans]
MGGVTIDTTTAVLDSQKQVINGAWACGEVVGGIHGANRIGGNAVADIIIFGILPVVTPPLTPDVKGRLRHPRSADAVLFSLKQSRLC